MKSQHKTDLDRFVELANVGAEHAADAFAQLVGRSIRTQAPVVVEGEGADRPTLGDEEKSRWSTGVFFEFEGCLDAIVGILFPGSASEALVRRIVGIESGDLAPQMIESALMEVGNILASHVASAIADELGSRLLPSIPSLAMEDSEVAFRTFVENAVGRDVPRIESALSDETGALRGRLILVPTAPFDSSDSA
jgi:chemotaxis protein CheY-P-specific phosphatase CheC